MSPAAGGAASPSRTRAPAAARRREAGTRSDPMLLVAVFVSGGAVMVVEILGTRVLSPFFGVGLFIWSALLSVTLGSLAAGYFLGGILADRAPRRRVLYAVILAAGVLVGLAPLFARPALIFGDGLGIRLGALASATLLFAPSLVAFGMVGPVAVRLAAFEVAVAGRAAGRVYAVSTAGSLLATLLAGFWLVPNFSVRAILFGTSVVLIVMAVLGMFREGASRAVAALLLAPFVGLAGARAGTLPGITILARAQSFYGRLSVVEDRARGVRFLRSDHSFLGGFDPKSHQPAFGFLHLLEAIRFARPRGRDLLQIGLGIGTLPMALSPHGIRTDVVEIDPEVIRLAREWFAFEPSGDVTCQDGRAFLHRVAKRYDFVVHDTFTGGAVPDHLLSVEVLERIREVLRPGGLLALNFVGAYQGPLAASAQAVAATVRHVFPHVRCFRDLSPAKDPEGLSNLLFFASDDPVDFAIPPGTTFESPLCEEILTSFQGWEVLRDVPAGAPVVTDARNPLARLSLPVSEAYRGLMRGLYGREFWLE